MCTDIYRGYVRLASKIMIVLSQILREIGFVKKSSVPEYRMVICYLQGEEGSDELPVTVLVRVLLIYVPENLTS